MSSCWCACAGHNQRWLSVLVFLWLTGCSPAPEGNGDARTLLAGWADSEPKEMRVEQPASLVRLFSEARNKELLLDWAEQYPFRFIRLLSHLKDRAFYEQFADHVVSSGKSFTMINLLAANATATASRMLALIRQKEHRDLRTKVSGVELKRASELQDVLVLEGESKDHFWRGGAMVVAQSSCHLAVATAGHNVLNNNAGLRTPLNQLRLLWHGKTLVITEAFPLVKPQRAVRDWVILLATKPRCDDEPDFPEIALKEQGQLPQGGLRVSLYCHHQAEHDPVSSLYREQCHIYPTDAGVLEHYKDQPPGKLGVHTCRSVTGSSGCPVMYEDSDKRYFLGMQIEGDRLTGAGIARLVGDDFSAAIRQVRERLQAE